MLSSLPHWASCEVFPGKQPASLVSMLETGPLALASHDWLVGGQEAGRSVEGAGMGLRGRWAVWSSEMVPMPPPHPQPGLSPHPHASWARTHSPGLRSLVGHSKPPSILCPSHNAPSFGPHFVPPAVPHPHFWPEPDRGNSSWQTPKAGMREIHKPDVLLQRERSGGWGK